MVPTLPSFHKLDPQRLDVRRIQLEGYLKTITSEEFLSDHLHVLGQVILFLSEGEYERQRTELKRMVSITPSTHTPPHTHTHTHTHSLPTSTLHTHSLPTLTGKHSPQPSKTCGHVDPRCTQVLWSVEFQDVSSDSQEAAIIRDPQTTRRRGEVMSLIGYEN